MYRIVRHPHYRPAALALAPRYSTLEGAVADMGDGLVIGPDGAVSAFHERHLSMLVRMADRDTTAHAIARGDLAIDHAVLYDTVGQA